MVCFLVCEGKSNAFLQQIKDKTYPFVTQMGNIKIMRCKKRTFVAKIFIMVSSHFPLFNISSEFLSAKHIQQLPPGAIRWQSPSNIALVKYWGKYGQQLPRNASVSFTLSQAITDTTLYYSPKASNKDGISLAFSFDGQPNEKFATKIQQFLTEMLPYFPFLSGLDLRIETHNTFPHSSGIASSASGLSALALCLCSLAQRVITAGQTNGNDNQNQSQNMAAFLQQASYIARLGSGSACRSVYGLAAIWGQTAACQPAHNEYAVPYGHALAPIFTSFHDDILIASRTEKKVSSRAGHALMEGNPFAQLRYQLAEQNMALLCQALQNGDLDTFINITEAEALMLHALMMTSNPSFILLEPTTLSMINLLRNFRSDTKIPVCFTLDAGPNLHVLYPDAYAAEVQSFIKTNLQPLCQSETVLANVLGQGPVLL